MQGIYMFLECIVDLISMYFLLGLLPWMLTNLKSRHGYVRKAADCAISNRINVFKAKGVILPEACLYSTYFTYWKYSRRRERLMNKDLHPLR